MHDLLQTILTTGVTELPHGTPEVHSGITREDCVLVERLVRESQALSAIEVGMAFGISSLAILSALTNNGSGARLISIDPNQSTLWKGAGLHLLRRASLDAHVEVIEQPSHVALPRLAEAGHRVDLAFIDGWHTFDHALIDFFYCDLMLRVGGIVMFDDVGYPAINRLVRFVLANRDYEFVDATRSTENAPLHLRSRRAVKRVFHRLAKTDRDPTDQHDREFAKLAHAQVVALRKRAEDTRPYDHFAQF